MRIEAEDGKVESCIDRVINRVMELYSRSDEARDSSIEKLARVSSLRGFDAGQRRDRYALDECKSYL